jgi:hypothetical protein
VGNPEAPAVAPVEVPVAAETVVATAVGMVAGTVAGGAKTNARCVEAIGARGRVRLLRAVINPTICRAIMYMTPIFTNLFCSFANSTVKR